jgi:hypothetical protein
MPYAAIMVSTNESIKEALNPEGGQNLKVFLLAGMYIVVHIYVYVSVCLCDILIDV